MMISKLKIKMILMATSGNGIGLISRHLLCASKLLSWSINLRDKSFHLFNNAIHISNLQRSIDVFLPSFKTMKYSGPVSAQQNVQEEEHSACLRTIIRKNHGVRWSKEHKVQIHCNLQLMLSILEEQILLIMLHIILSPSKN